MIDKKSLFLEINNQLGLNCSDSVDDGVLVRAAQLVIENNISVISVNPGAIVKLWAWLEQTPVQIMTRFSWKFDISKLALDINTAFKQGADGAQISLKYDDFNDFVNKLAPFSEDLFFNKKLFIELNIAEIGPFDWENIFSSLNKLNAGLLLSNDYEIIGNKNTSDFVGRIYGLFDFLEIGFNAEMHFNLGEDYNKIEQVWRLAEKSRPELLPQILFFVKN